VSATRPPARFPEHQPELSGADELNELEELGDDAIIAQQTAAHSLRPRANVAEEPRSVVITERLDSTPPAVQPPAEPPPKSSAEATVVIRDRRALDEMRMQIVRRQQQKQSRVLGHRALYLWGALGLAAFVLGGVVAFLATESRPDSTTSDARSANTGSEARIAVPSTPPKPAPDGQADGPRIDKVKESTRAVRLDDLPVERRRKAVSNSPTLPESVVPKASR